MWDPFTGELLGSPDGRGSGAVAWGHGADGRLLLAWDIDRRAFIVGQPLSGEPGDVFTSRAGESFSVAWGYRADGRPLLAARSSTAVQIWDAETRELLQTISDPGNVVLTPVAWGYLPDGRSVLATISPGTEVSIYDPVSGEKLQSASAMTDATTWTLSWGYRPDGDPLLAACSEAGVCVWSERDGEFTASVLTETSAYSGAWAPLTDGRLLLATTTEDALQLWDVHRVSLLYETPIESAEGWDILDWIAAPDGRLLLASAEVHARIRIWDVVLDPPARWTGDPPRSRGDRGRARAESRPVTGGVVTTDGRLLLSATSADRQIHVWDLALDPPVPPSPAPSGARSGRATRPTARPGQPGRVLESPEDVTPRFEGAEGLAPTYTIRSAVRSDGCILMAAAYSHGNALRVWAASTGDLLYVLQDRKSVV